VYQICSKSFDKILKSSELTKDEILVRMRDAMTTCFSESVKKLQNRKEQTELIKEFRVSILMC